MIVIESKDFYFIAKYIVPYVPFYIISILLLADIEMYFASVKREKRSRNAYSCVWRTL